MELSVCIYDTDPSKAEQLQRYVAAVLFHADYRAKVMSCSAGNALRKLTEAYPFVDLLFLPATEDGLRYGEAMRQVNRTTTLVFLSDDGAHILRAFRSLPIAFLIDHKNRQKLSETILRAASWAAHGKRVFCHESRTQILQLSYEEIDYFESEYRIVHIYRTDGTHETITAKLDDVEAMLPSSSFCRCHKSYLVNLKNIAAVNKSERTVLFKSGAKVFSSKAMYPTLVASLKGDVTFETI